jgi:hypothetical protein
MAAAILPRQINSQSALQAASPAFESARLLDIVGVGVDTIQAFALILILCAGLSVFIALYNALRERSYDLAVMRSLVPRGKLLTAVLLEGLILAALAQRSVSSSTPDDRSAAAYSRFAAHPRHGPHLRPGDDADPACARRRTAVRVASRCSRHRTDIAELLRRGEP